MITKILKIEKDLVTVELKDRDYTEILYISQFLERINKQLQND
jgi:hypothetical protein